MGTGFLNNTAIGGQNAVAHHDPTKRSLHSLLAGNRKFEVKHLGAVWRDAAQSSADQFAAKPSAYVPKFNGNCVGALALRAGLIATDDQVWEFFGNNMYRFFAERRRQRWLQGVWQATAVKPRLPSR